MKKKPTQQDTRANETYLIRRGEKVTFPIVKLSSIRIEGTVNRVRVEIEGTDKKMYLVDPIDIRTLDDDGKVVFNNVLGKNNLYNP